MWVVSHSLNEIEAMCKRAARGGGLSWGLCEEAAKGTRWLAAYGYPGPELLADLLELNDQKPRAGVTPATLENTWYAPAGRLCPITAGAAMSDSAVKMENDETIVMRGVSQPLLVVPFAAGAALRLGAAVSVTWGDVRLTTDGHRLCARGRRDDILAAHAVELRCFAPTEMTTPAAPVMRASVAEACWRRLGVFAQRTYAPATDASRRLGAGAGLNDND
ncbi:DUF3726 domain-containing protein [Candidatus Halocynthiibacter alkanivorans]|uniref:DUF3726 domain-containing protein n=1 Tax=Candidatus Halocynthiibacter alkanivorans TaxID=2267619 RepID=UPI001F1C07AC|nr:DUF3726 domain-containing protein [Candidatus Halocynthiibacter alkanivorans]